MSDVIAVTGADGFIGSHLVEALVRDGSLVRALVLYNSFGSFGWLDSLPSDVLESIDIRMGDVRDPRCVQELIDGASSVYHLAALIAVPYSYAAPQSYVDTNVTGTLNVLEAVRARGAGRLIHTSTSETYGTAQRVPIGEDHPLQAQSPYAATKIAADKLAESYHRSYGTPVVTLRPFNTYGPRQSSRAVIPTVVTQIARGNSSLRLGALAPLRDFMYVADTVAAFRTVGRAPASEVVGETFNAGTGESESVGAVVAMIAELMNADVDVTQDEDRLRPEDSEVQVLECNSAKLTRCTGWRPQYPLRDGLKQTIEWLTEPKNLARYVPERYL